MYGLGWVWVGWDGNLCVGLFYEHCFAVLIRMFEKSFKVRIFKLVSDRDFDLSALKFSIYELNENITVFDDLHCLSQMN